MYLSHTTDVTGTGHWHHNHWWFLQLTVLQFLERKNGFWILDVLTSEVSRWSSWRNRAWIRKSWVKRREFQKSINFASILKIINGLNGYAPELVNGYRPEYVDHRNLDGNKIFKTSRLLYLDFAKMHTLALQTLLKCIFNTFKLC